MTLFHMDYMPLGWIMLSSFFIFFVLLGIAAYVYTAIALMTIAKKMKTPNSWLAWIPFANLYLMTQIAKVEWWTMLVVLIAFIPFLSSLGGIATAGVTVWWWWRIAERMHRPVWFGFLMIIPFVNLIAIGIMAWGKK